MNLETFKITILHPGEASTKRAIITKEGKIIAVNGYEVDGTNAKMDITLKALVLNTQKINGLLSATESLSWLLEKSGLLDDIEDKEEKEAFIVKWQTYQIDDEEWEDLDCIFNFVEKNYPELLG